MVERGLADATQKFYKNKLGAFRKFLVQIKKVQTLELVTEEEIKMMLAEGKDITFTDTAVTIRSGVTDANREEIKNLALELAGGCNNDEKEENSVKYVCEICGYEYDESAGDPDNGIAPGTAFEDLPEDFVCPVCGASKDDFEAE